MEHSFMIVFGDKVLPASFRDIRDFSAALSLCMALGHEPLKWYILRPDGEDHLDKSTPLVYNNNHRRSLLYELQEQIL